MTGNINPKVSLIIACYNQADYLEKVLESLLNQSFSEFEILIADDGSGNDFRKIVERYKEKFKFPLLHVWHEDKGFRKTIIVNKAVETSNSDYLVFIDGDCILHRHFVKRHFLRRKKGVVLSGRRIMFDEKLSKTITIEQIKNSEFEKKSFWWNNCKPKERKRGLYLPLIFNLINSGKKNYWIFGSNFSIHKSDFVDVNGYDQNIIGRGLEDINLSQRCKLKGYPIKRLTYEALQYHLFHNSDPVPHLGETQKMFVNPTEYYAKNGINSVCL